MPQKCFLEVTNFILYGFYLNKIKIQNKFLNASENSGRLRSEKTKEPGCLPMTFKTETFQQNFGVRSAEVALVMQGRCVWTASQSPVHAGEMAPYNRALAWGDVGTSDGTGRAQERTGRNKRRREPEGKNVVNRARSLLDRAKEHSKMRRKAWPSWRGLGRAEAHTQQTGQRNLKALVWASPSVEHCRQ